MRRPRPRGAKVSVPSSEEHAAPRPANFKATGMRSRPLLVYTLALVGSLAVARWQSSFEAKVATRTVSAVVPWGYGHQIEAALPEIGAVRDAKVASSRLA